MAVEGARFSVGDAHYAQGDSECCVTAIEMGATVTLRFALHSGRAERELGFRPSSRIGLARAGDGALRLETASV